MQCFRYLSVLIYLEKVLRSMWVKKRYFGRMVQTYFSCCSFSFTKYPYQIMQYQEANTIPILHSLQRRNSLGLVEPRIRLDAMIRDPFSNPLETTMLLCDIECTDHCATWGKPYIECETNILAMKEHMQAMVDTRYC